MDVIDANWIKARLTGRRGEQSALATAMGVGAPEVSKILSGRRRVQPEEIPRVIAYFRDSDRHDESSRNPVAMIDVYDVRASAGDGSVVEAEDVVGRLSFPLGYLEKITRTHPRHLAIISVKGDSMEPTLKDDDVVMLDTSKTSLDYDGLFVLRFGDALHVKRIGRAPGGAVRVISDNDAFPDQDFPRHEVEAVGRVVWVGKKI